MECGAKKDNGKNVGRKRGGNACEISFQKIIPLSGAQRGGEGRGNARKAEFRLL